MVGNQKSGVVALSSSSYRGRNYTLDLNGYTVEMTEDSSCGLLFVYEPHLTIVDSSDDGCGALVNNVASSRGPRGAVWVGNNGSLKVESGTISGVDYAIKGDGRAAKVAVEGGRFKTTSSTYSKDIFTSARGSFPAASSPKRCRPRKSRTATSAWRTPMKPRRMRIRTRW